MTTRTITVSLWVRRVDGECPGCTFDALIRIKTYTLKETGVTVYGDKTYCGRCKAEEIRDGK